MIIHTYHYNSAHIVIEIVLSVRKNQSLFSALLSFLEPSFRELMCACCCRIIASLCLSQCHSNFFAPESPLRMFQRSIILRLVKKHKILINHVLRNFWLEVYTDMMYRVSCFWSCVGIQSWGTETIHFIFLFWTLKPNLMKITKHKANSSVYCCKSRKDFRRAMNWASVWPAKQDRCNRLIIAEGRH